MTHKVAFHQGLRCLLKNKNNEIKKRITRDRNASFYIYKKILTGNPLKFKMDNSILLASIYVDDPS